MTVQVGPGPATSRQGPRASVVALPRSVSFADEFTSLWGVLSSWPSAFQDMGFLKHSSRACMEHQNQWGGAGGGPQNLAKPPLWPPDVKTEASGTSLE